MNTKVSEEHPEPVSLEDEDIGSFGLLVATYHTTRIHNLENILRRVYRLFQV
jgi:hypothetical protein